MRTRNCLGVFAALLIGACATQENLAVEKPCMSGLEQAQKELDAAKTQGFGGSVAWTKASSLISAAKLQAGFRKYSNCVEKIKRARALIKESQRPVAKN